MGRMCWIDGHRIESSHHPKGWRWRVLVFRLLNVYSFIFRTGWAQHSVSHWSMCMMVILANGCARALCVLWPWEFRKGWVGLLRANGECRSGTQQQYGIELCAHIYENSYISLFNTFHTWAVWSRTHLKHKQTTHCATRAPCGECKGHCVICALSLYGCIEMYVCLA